MAAQTGFSHPTIRRMWAAFGLHRSQTFKLSDDPLFVDKVRDSVGPYLSPPNRTLVLSIDEESQIEALDGEQPILPMMRDDLAVRRPRCRLGRRHRQVLQRHRVAKFLNFFKEIDAQVPEELDVHTVMDNMPPTRHPRSRRGSPAARIISWTSRRLRRHGSIRSSAGLQSSPKKRAPARRSYLGQATA
jgi:hypothetical protein